MADKYRGQYGEHDYNTEPDEDTRPEFTGEAYKDRASEVAPEIYPGRTDFGGSDAKFLDKDADDARNGYDNKAQNGNDLDNNFAQHAVENDNYGLREEDAEEDDSEDVTADEDAE